MAKKIRLLQWGDEMQYPNAKVEIGKNHFFLYVAFRIHRRGFDFGIWRWKPFAHMRKVALAGDVGPFGEQWN